MWIFKWKSASESFSEHLKMSHLKSFLICNATIQNDKKPYGFLFITSFDGNIFKKDRH